MAYLNIQKAEFNRATENLIEIAWKYESLKAEYDFLTNTDSMKKITNIILLEPRGISRRLF